MNIDLKNKLFRLDKLSPFEKLLGIRHPHLMNLDLFKYKRLLIILKVESNSLALQVIGGVLKSLDLFQVNFFLLISELISLRLPLLAESVALSPQPKVHKQSCFA